MLRCPMAAKAPSPIEAIETKTMICCHCTATAGNAISDTRMKTAIAATFGRGAKKAVIGVGAPS